MSRPLIIVIVAIVLCGATYYWGTLKDLEQHRPEVSEHDVFKHLDVSCRERYGQTYSFRTNRCCEAATSGTCAPL
jgi:hypothetical protein